MTEYVETRVTLRPLRQAIKQYLDTKPDLHTITLKSMREAVAQILHNTPEALRGFKEEFELALTRYSAAESGGKYKKFTTEESKQIMERVHSFIAENNLQVSDICPALRDTDERTPRQKYSLWKELSLQFPHKSRDVIYQHVMRQLMRHTQTKAWTDEDKNTIAALVQQHGNQWAKIGRLMGKLPDDCKQAYYRMRPRTAAGAYSPEEDAEIIDAVRKLLHLPASTSVSSIDTSNIPWVALAHRLSNKRRPNDYQKHWISLRAKDGRGDGPRDFAQDDRRILLLLQQMEANDISDVNWAEVDRNLLLTRETAGRRWKLLCRNHCNPHDSFETCLNKLSHILGVNTTSEIEEETEEVAQAPETVLFTTDASAAEPTFNLSADQDEDESVESEHPQIGIKVEKKQGRDASDVDLTGHNAPATISGNNFKEVTDEKQKDKTHKKHKKKRDRDTAVVDAVVTNPAISILEPSFNLLENDSDDESLVVEEPQKVKKHKKKRDRERSDTSASVPAVEGVESSHKKHKKKKHKKEHRSEKE